ncbi:MAG: hypothetical protein ABSC10_06400 [Candidatus Acidiferrales bacterium]|jgi:hypothetical protein
MRAKLSALYYPDFWIEYKTLLKCILLFDEIHFMDRPSFTFGGRYGMVGAESPLRQHEESFRKEGMPFYVHEAPGGVVVGELLNEVESDLRDTTFMSRFQDGLRLSPHFRKLHIQPGDYGNGETHETIFHKIAAIDLEHSRSALEIFNDPLVRHMDPATPEGCLKILASDAAFCSAKMNFAMRVGVQNGFSPLADASPYSDLLGAKYRRAIGATGTATRPIPTTDLSLAILDELVPDEALNKMNIGDAIRYRKESEFAREAFLEHLLTLHAKLGDVPSDGNYAASIEKILATEVRPAVVDFRNQLLTIHEKLFGRIVAGALAVASSSGLVQVFGDITWQKLFSLVGAAGAYMAKEAINARAEERAARRECAISYLLDLEGARKQ